jgi:DNA-binding transcriptional LysR family regulator
MEYTRNDIAAFLEVVRTGSVSRAATHIGVSQPSVSKAIKRLETEAGFPLFERGARGARLTGEGHVFLETARRLQVQHMELVRTAADLRARHAGLLRIGVTSPAADSLAVRAIADMVRRRPALRIQLVIGRSDALDHAVLDGQLDMAVVPSYPGESLGCTTLDISEDLSRVVVRAGHPLTRATHLDIQDLTPYGWVMPAPNSAARRHVFKIFARHGAPAPHVCIEAEYTSEAAMGLVMATDLLSTVPASVLRGWLGRVQPLPIPALDIRRTQVLLSHPQARWTPLMTDFRNGLLDMRPITMP